MLYGLLDNRKGNSICIALFIFALGLGVLRFDSADFQKGNPLLDERVGRSVVAEGIIIDEPNERENNTQLVVLLNQLRMLIEQQVSTEVVNAVLVQLHAEGFNPTFDQLIGALNMLAHLVNEIDSLGALLAQFPGGLKTKVAGLGLWLPKMLNL